MLVPRLRFKEFTDEWNSYRIKDLFVIKNGLNKNKEYFGVGTPIINYMDINKNEILTKNKIKGKVTLSPKEINLFKVNKGDLFFARTSETSEEIGFTASLIEDIENCVYSGFLLKATPLKSNISPLFSGFYFRNPNMRIEIIKHSSITTRALTNGTLLYPMIVNIPSIDEQEKIGKLLILLNKKIELQSKKVNVLKLYKKGLVLNLMKNRNEWSEYKVKDIFNITRGIVIPKIDLSEKSNDEYKYPVYSSQTFNKGILGYDNKYDFDGKYLTWTTDGANAGKVFFRNGKFRCTNVCGVLYENNVKYTNELVAELLNYVTPKHVSYVGNPKLMNNVMGEIKINLPKDELQISISRIINSFSNKIELENEKLEKLQVLKKGFMQVMFA